MGISFDNVRVAYGSVEALKHIDLAMGAGMTFAIGKNGSGKTTLLQTAAGLIRPASGEMRLDGLPYASAAGELRRSLGYLPQTIDFPEQMTPRKLIAFLARLRFLEPQEGAYWMEALGVGDLIERPFGEMSLGEVRLVGLAQALMGSPQWLLLDEFTSNLSLEERAAVYRCLRRLQAQRKERVFLLSTHDYRDIEALGGTIILLEEGEVVYCGRPEYLIQAASGKYAPEVKQPLSPLNRTPTLEEASQWYLQERAQRITEFETP